MLAAGTDIDDNSVSSSEAATAAAMAAAGESTEQTKVFYTEGDVALKGVRLKMLNSSMRRCVCCGRSSSFRQSHPLLLVNQDDCSCDLNTTFEFRYVCILGGHLVVMKCTLLFEFVRSHEQCF